MNYLELPVADTGTAKRFYAEVFGWTFADYGPTYAATTSGDTDVGLQADPAERTAAALPVIEVDNLDATLAAVERAGGTITAPIFTFPGGRRLHFRDADGHVLAAMQALSSPPTAPRRSPNATRASARHPTCRVASRPDRSARSVRRGRTATRPGIR